MSVIYAIPSRGRAKVVGEKTIRALSDAGVAATDIHLWVDEDEEDEYLAAIDRPKVGEIKVGPRGTNLRDKRNLIARAYPVGTRLVECDDDVTAYWYARTRKRPLIPLNNLPTLVEWAFRTCDRLGIGLWGLYPVDNPYFMRPAATTDLRYIAGPTWGFTVTGDDTELVALDDKEDFERSARFAIRDGGVLRINWASYSTSYYGDTGGMQAYRTPESVTDGALRLAAMYPEMVKIKQAANHRGTTEVTLTRGYSVCPPLQVPREWS